MGRQLMLYVDDKGQDEGEVRHQASSDGPSGGRSDVRISGTPCVSLGCLRPLRIHLHNHSSRVLWVYCCLDLCTQSTQSNSRNGCPGPCFLVECVRLRSFRIYISMLAHMQLQTSRSPMEWKQADLSAVVYIANKKAMYGVLLEAIHRSFISGHHCRAVVHLQ